MGRKQKPVHQYNGNTGIFIRQFPSISSAAKKTGAQVSNLKYACELEIRCRNYYWRYAEEKKLLKVRINEFNRGGKKVCIYKICTDGKAKKFTVCNTISEAVKLTGISHTTIRNICRGKIKMYREYTFEFVNEEDNWNRKASFDLYDIIRKNSRSYYKVPVKLTKDNKIYKFDSIAEASRELKINSKSISNVLAGRWKTAGGYNIVKD